MCIAFAYNRGMRIIGHLDMDAFFASIEERDNPRLAGRPIVVGADPENGRARGVVSTANYAARAYGIRSALPISKAWAFSEAAKKKGLPPAVFMGVNMQKYAEVSSRVIAILEKYSPTVEQASVDEAYFDMSSAGSYEKAREVARAMKKEIKNKERLTASVGIGPNKLIAKIASDCEKPDGLTVVQEDDAENFLAPLGIRVIPGVGPKSEEQFKKLGIKTVGDARRLSREQLTEMMGKWGSELYEKLRGRSDSPLVTEYIAKSIGRHETFAHDVPPGEKLADRKFLEKALAELAEDVWLNFRSDTARGDHSTFRKVTITVRFADFKTVTRTTTLAEPVAAADPKASEILRFQALRLFMPFLDRRENPGRKSLRLLGVRVEDLK
jgi:DNA polymerase IV (archaeal DinB-like DNA polymerase)